MKRGRGRPTKVTAQVQKTICGYLERGAPDDVAALLSGIEEGTFYRAIRRMPDFGFAVKSARAKFVWLLIQAALKFATDAKQWAGVVTIGERLKPHYFGKVERHEITGRDGAPLSINQSSYIIAIRNALGFAPERPGKALAEAPPCGDGRGSDAEVLSADPVEAVPAGVDR